MREVELGRACTGKHSNELKSSIRAVEGSFPGAQHVPARHGDGLAGWTQGDMLHNLKQHGYQPLDRDVVEVEGSGSHGHWKNLNDRGEDKDAGEARIT